MPSLHARYELKPEHIAIKSFGAFEIIDVERCFQNRLRLHGTYITASFCSSTRRPIPLRASPISSRNSASEKGAPSAVP